MPDTILIHGARQLIAARGSREPRRGAELSHLNIIEDGSLLVEGASVLEVGPSRRIENLAKAKRATVIDANGRVVMPAFVDCDTDSLLRAAPSADWHPEHDGAPTPAEHSLCVPGPRLRAEAPRILAGMLRHGTLVVETKAREMRELRALLSLQSDVEVLPTIAVQSEPEPGDGLLASAKRRGLARSAQIRNSVSIAEAMRAVRDAGFRLRVDFTNSGTSVPGFHEAVAQDPAAVVGLDQLCDEGMSALASSRTVVVLEPGVAFHLGAVSNAPARALIDRGAAVALATGYGPFTNPSYSMSVAISLACRNMHFSPAEAVVAATINAAHALGIGDRTGSLEPGKQADILVLATPDYRMLAWEFGINLVQMVIRKGRVVYDAAIPQ